MGTNFDTILLQKESNNSVGIIPRAAIHLFEGIEQRKKAARDEEKVEPSFEVCVQFIEVYLSDTV
jgi:hypothetical protein